MVLIHQHRIALNCDCNVAPLPCRQQPYLEMRLPTIALVFLIAGQREIRTVVLKAYFHLGDKSGNDSRCASGQPTHFLALVSST